MALFQFAMSGKTIVSLYCSKLCIYVKRNTVGQILKNIIFPHVVHNKRRDIKLNYFTPALKSMSNYSRPPYYLNLNSLTPALKPMSNYSQPPYYLNLNYITPALKPMSNYSWFPYYLNLNYLTPALKPMSN